MKLARLVLAVAAAGLAFSAQAAERAVTLDVANMSCVTCPLTVKTAIKRVPGVREVAVDFDAKQARVTFDDSQASVQALEKASTDVGFPATARK